MCVELNLMVKDDTKVSINSVNTGSLYRSGNIITSNTCGISERIYLFIYLFIIILPQGKEQHKRQSCTRYCPNTEHIQPLNKTLTKLNKSTTIYYNYIYKTTNQQQ